MFKKVLYVLVVLVFLTGCAPKVLTQTPTVVPEEFSPVPPAETLSPIELRDPLLLQGKQVDLISYQEIDNHLLRLVMRERDSERLVAVTITEFIYFPVTVVNGITSVDYSTTAMTYYNGDFFTVNPKFQDTFPSNSAGTVYVQVGDGFSMFAVTGLFIPTETDRYIQGLVDDYQKNRTRKAEMIGARALHNAELVDQNDPLSENHFNSKFESGMSDLSFSIPSTQCSYLAESYSEWGTEWHEYGYLTEELCGSSESQNPLPGLESQLESQYDSLAIDHTTFISMMSMSFDDFSRYYSYVSNMLPYVFELAYARGEICPGGQVDLPNGMTGTAFESPGWVDIDGGFVFEHGIDFVVSFGEQHFFIPYGGYFVVTDARQTRDIYALFTTCSER
jgi:hypothetical protein